MEPSCSDESKETFTQQCNRSERGWSRLALVRMQRVSFKIKFRLKDVRANCFCAYLLRTQIQRSRHGFERAG